MGTMGPMALASALSFAAGAMLYVVFGELLPESAALWRNRVPAPLRSSAIARGTGHPVHLFQCVTGGPGASEGPVRHDGLPQTCIKVFGRMGGV